MSDYSVYETVQEIKQFVYSKTDVPSVATLQECFETYRALIDQFSEDLENVAQGIEAGLDRPINHPSDDVEPTLPDGTTTSTATVDEPEEVAPVVTDDTADPLNPPIDLAQAPVTEIDPAQQPVTEIPDPATSIAANVEDSPPAESQDTPVLAPDGTLPDPVAANVPVTDEDVATAVEASVPPVEDTGDGGLDSAVTPPADTVAPTSDDPDVAQAQADANQSVDTDDTGASPAPTTVDPQQQGDTEPGPVAEDVAPVTPDPASVTELVEAANATPEGVGTPADPGSLPDNQ